MTDQAQSSNSLTMLRRRLFGAAILLKTLLPVVIVSALFISIIAITNAFSDSLEKNVVHIKTRMAEAGTHLEAIEKEAQRLAMEVEGIKREGKRFSGNVSKAIKPIRSSVNKAWTTIRKVSRAIENVINAIIKPLNTLLPKKLKLKPFRLFKIKIPKIKLPNLDLDFNLEPDLSALEALQETAQGLQQDLQSSTEELVVTISKWISIIAIAIALFVVWFLLVIAAFLMRIKARLLAGLQLLKGREVENAIIYF